MTNAELAPLPLDVYKRVAKRDLAHRVYIKRLERVIKRTWEEK